MQGMSAEIWKGDVLTSQIDPFLVHIHQDSVDGWAHLQAKKARPEWVMCTRRLHITPQGILRTPAGQVWDRTWEEGKGWEQKVLKPKS